LKSSVHQLVSTFSPRDAVGNIVLSMRKILREAGYNSEIYAQTIHPEMKNEALPYTNFDKIKSNDILIYHHSFASDLVDFLLPLQNKIILIYHNITPSHFFIGVDEKIVAGCILGRQQLDKLKNKVEIGLTFSKFTEQELNEKGIKNTGVISAILNRGIQKFEKNVSFENKFHDYVNILSVGRLVPHKKIEDLLKAFAFYNKCLNNKSQLFIIGKYDSSEPYFQWLQNVINTLELKNVNFLSDVSDEDLESYYEIANIYLSMSEHEGFCVPLVESMHHKVPILAYGAAAIPETLDGSGILVKEKNFEEIAEIIHIITENQNLREKIVQRQNDRLQRLDSHAAASEFLKHVKNLEK